MKRRTTRRDGFAGQHMIVLPEPLRASAKKHALLRGLYVTDAGYFPAAAGHRVERPQGAPTTLAILCLRGAGWVELAGQRRDIVAGELIWLAAREPHAYGAADARPWTIAWAHFAGEEVTAWRDFLASGYRLDDAVFRLPADRVDELALDRVHAALERGAALRWQVSAASALRASLAKAGEILVEGGGQRSARDRVAASVEGLEREWRRPYRLEELAAAAGMSVTHYCAHFRQLTGFAPVDFLIRQRVRQACRLFDTTTSTVQEVAAAVGYDDPYYFTRCFRRVMGRSPRDYRKVPKG